MSLSIILPSFNDFDDVRAGLAYLQDNIQDLEFDVIIVDDGSRFTNDYMLLAKSFKNVQLVTHNINLGKGAAVQSGVFHSNAEYIIFVDSDVPFYYQNICDIFEILSKENVDIVCGDRGSDCQNSQKIPLVRRLLSHLFNLIASLLMGQSGIDNQCGLKGFSAPAAKELFKDLVVNRYSFDTEILYKAQIKNLRIKSLPVQLRVNTPGSLRLYKDGARMLFDLVLIFLKFKVMKRYNSRGYKLED